MSALKEKPRWLSAFLTLAILSVALEAVLYPGHVRLVLDLLPPSATAGDKATVLQAMNSEALARLAFLPVRLFIGWFVYALALFYASKMIAVREPFRIVQMFSLAVHAEGVLFLGTCASAISTAQTLDASRRAIPFGVVSFFHNVDFSYFAPLNTLNLFTLAYIVILTSGLSVLCGFSSIKSFLVVVGIWTMSVLLNIGILTVLRRELHLLV